MNHTWHLWGGAAIVPDAFLSTTMPRRANLHTPSTARVYDLLLGGSAHWAIDRSFANRMLDTFPEFRDIAKANRVLVDRVVRHLARRGVRQFVDIGSGALSSGNTHQIANEIAPDTKVVYVDNDPVAVAHAEILLDQEGDPDRHVVVNADLRSPDKLWCRVSSTGVLDQAEPLAVLMFSVLDSLSPRSGDPDPAAQLMHRYRDLVPHGSYLGISHITHDGVPAELTPKLAVLHHMCDDWHISKMYCRSRAAVEALLGDFELVEPRMVWAPEWHPEESPSEVHFATPSHSALWTGVGQKV